MRLLMVASVAVSDRETQLVHIRLPASLHAQVKRVADDEGVTLNTFLVAVIARGTAEFSIHPADSPSEERMVLVNPRTKAAHDPDCTWLQGASTGTRPIDVGDYLQVPEGGPFPEGTHGVSCCLPPLPPGTPRSSRKRRS